MKHLFFLPANPYLSSLGAPQINENGKDITVIPGNFLEGIDTKRFVKKARGFLNSVTPISKVYAAKLQAIDIFWNVPCPAELRKLISYYANQK